MADTERNVAIRITGQNLSGPATAAVEKALGNIKKLSDDTSTSTAKLSREYGSLNSAARAVSDAQQRVYADMAKVNQLASQFGGAQQLRSAEEYAAAVSKIGGASKLTASEQQRINGAVTEAIAKYRALGQDAPAHLLSLQRATASTQTATGGLLSSVTKLAAGFGIAFSGQAVVQGVLSFTKGVFEAADDVKDLSERMGVGIVRAQQFGTAARQSGADIETVSTGIGKMNQNLSAGSDQTITTLKGIGLSISQLRAQEPEDAFLAITDAIQKIPNPMDQSRVAVELFGKAGEKLLPGIRSGFRDAADAAQAMSEDTVKALADAKQSWEDFLNTITIKTGNFIGDTMKRLGATPEQLRAAILEAQLEAVRQGDLGFTGTGATDKYYDAALTRILNRKDIALTGASKNGPGSDETAAAAKKAADEFKKGLEQILKMESDYYEARDKRMLTSYDFERTQIDRWVADQRRGFQGSLAQVQQYYAAIDKLAGERRLQNALNEALSQAFTNVADMTSGGQRLDPRFYQYLQDDLTAFLRNRPSATLPAAPPNYRAMIADAFTNISDMEHGGQGMNPRDAEKEFKNLHTALSTTSSLFEHLAQVSDGSMSMVSRAIGSAVQTADAMIVSLHQMTKEGATTGDKVAGAIGIIGASAQAVQSGVQFSKQLGGGRLGGAAGGALAGAQIGALGGPLGMGIGAGVGGVLGLIAGSGLQKDPAQDFAKQFGGFEQLHAQLVSLGTAGRDMWRALTEGMAHSDPSAQRDAIAQITEALGKQNALLTKYGLTLDDLKTPQQRFQDSLLAIGQDYQDLQSYGLGDDKISKSMAAGLNSMVRAALDAGQKIPGAFEPVLEQLIKGGGLADDLAARLQGVAVKAKVPWEDMQQAAQDLGVDITKLGGQFDRAKWSSVVGDAADKFNLLIQNGTEASVVVDGISTNANGVQDAIRNLVRSSIALGTEIPANAKPMIQALFDAGQLTDDNGDKLESLKDVKFGKTVAEQFDPLVEALWGIVDIFNKDLPASLEELRRQAGIPIDVTVREHHESDRSNSDQNQNDGPFGDKDGDGVNNTDDRFPDDPNQYAMGGIAEGRQVAILAERGRREIVGSEAFMTNALVGALQRIGPGRVSTTQTAASASSEQPIVVQAVLQVDREVLGRVTARAQTSHFRRDAADRAEYRATVNG